MHSIILYGGRVQPLGIYSASQLLLIIQFSWICLPGVLVNNMMYRDLLSCIKFPPVLQATKSEIFRTMLASDECKAAAEDTVSLPELSHDELKCLLEFLYAGSLPKGSADKHLYSMLVAADKYDIPFLRKVCEHQILHSLDSSNALDVLEVSEVCSNRMLKDHAMSSVVRYVEDVVFSTRYDEFALKNAHLCVEITRALLREMKDKKEHETSN